MPPKKVNNKPSQIVNLENCSLPACGYGKCRVNSRKNPNCFCNLGEKFWFSTIKDSHWTSLKDPEDERKDEGGYIGLKNLGATCYVNTFLQLWFNNKAFRSAIYQWKQEGFFLSPIEIINEEDNMFKSISLDFGGDSSDAICGHLQYLFSLLQCSSRRYVDPLYFVKSLGLQTDEQQDAQEFSKLFISLLREQNEYLSNIIDDQFEGRYQYKTRCSVCSSVTGRSSKFNELDLNIKGHFKLSECMKEFLKKEVLDGDNKYFCSSCQMKQDATRQIILEHLPPVLNIQLLRFVFDRQSGTKKKLNTTINFPEHLDMNEFMYFENVDDGLYHLNTVLFHCGLSAHSGHYVAHIFDSDKNVWCRYNDENVTVMKGGTLGGEDEEEEKVKKNKKGDGHTSKNAYMLVYSRMVSESEKCVVPDNMVEVVSKDNGLFEEWVSHQVTERNASIGKGQEKEDFIKNIYATLPVTEGKPYEWISTSWLRKWLNPDNDTIPPIHNSALQCCHCSPDPLKIPSMKRISSQAANSLFSSFRGDVRLVGESLCTLCIENNRKKEEFESKLAEDYKLVTKPLKGSEQEGFWVSKKSLKCFKQLAMQKYSLSEENTISDEVKDDTTTSNSNHLSDTSLSIEDASDTSLTVEETRNNSEEAKRFTFQEDILCSEHDQLSLNENTRKIVSPEVWHRCMEYFPDAVAFPYDSKTCELCQRKLLNSMEEKKTRKSLANEQKQALGFLFEDSIQRMQDFICGGDGVYHVLLSSFISSWKKVIRSGGNLNSLSADNSDMFCEHGLILYTAEEIIDECMGDDPELFLIAENEYNSLKTFFPVTDDIELSSVCVKDGGGSRHYGVAPDFCPTCRNNRLLEDAEDSRRYTSAPIFVSKMMKTHVIDDDTGTSCNFNNDVCIGDNDDVVCIDDDEEIKFIKEKDDDDKDAKNYSMSSKRLHIPGETRRSNRKRMKRGEYMLHVSSHQSLKELKIQLLGIYSVLPIEQTLSLDSGQVLDGDDRCLIDLGVSPGCHLTLTVDEPNKSALLSDESSNKPRILESGFKGTNLICGSTT